MAAPMIGGFLSKLMGQMGGMGGMLGKGATQAGAQQGLAMGNMMQGGGMPGGGGKGGISPQGMGGMIGKFSSPSSGKAPDMIGAGMQAGQQGMGAQQLMGAVNQLQQQPQQWQPPGPMQNSIQGPAAEYLRRLMMGG